MYKKKFHFRQFWHKVLYFICFLTFALPIQAQSLDLQDRIGLHQYSYDAYLGGLHVGELRLDFTLGKGSYHIESSVKGAGFMQNLLKVEGNVSTRGTIEDGMIIPDKFESQAVWRGNSSSSQITFINGAEPQYSYLPKEKAFKPEEYPKGELLGTIDPMSLSLHIAMQIVTSNNCTIERRLFSGRGRYNVKVHDLGMSSLPPNKILGKIDGLHRCLAEVNKVFAKDDPKQKDFKPVEVNMYLLTEDGASLPHPLLIEGERKGLVGKVWLKEYIFTPTN